MDNLAEILRHGGPPELEQQYVAYVGEVVRRAEPTARWTWRVRLSGSYPFLEINQFLISPADQVRQFVDNQTRGRSLRGSIEDLLLFQQDPSDATTQKLGWHDVVIHERADKGLRRILHEWRLYRNNELRK